jgi:hypothetical protein
VATATTVTDDATSLPGGPPPALFGDAVTFTATVAGGATTPTGTVRWAVSGEGPAGADVQAGVVPCADSPLVDGVATCAVTPGQYWDDGNGNWADWVWPITATATYLPDGSSGHLGSSGTDSTSKITIDGLNPKPKSPWREFTGDIDLTVVAHDSLGRPMQAIWWCPFSMCSDTLTQHVFQELVPGISTFVVPAVCPAGVDQPRSFECERPLPYLTINLDNETQPPA